MRGFAVGRRVPIGCAAKSGADAGSFRRGLDVGEDRTAFGVDSPRPIKLADELGGGEKFAGCPVEHVDKAVAIRFNQQLARPALVTCMNQNWGLSGVIVKKVVRGKLKVPL